MVQQHLLPASCWALRTEPPVAFRVKAAEPAGWMFFPLLPTCLCSALGWVVVRGTQTARARPRCLHRVALRYFLPQAPTSDPSEKDIWVLLITGAIYGASHAHGYTTSRITADITGGRPRAQGLAWVSLCHSRTLRCSSAIGQCID